MCTSVWLTVWKTVESPWFTFSTWTSDNLVKVLRTNNFDFLIPRIASKWQNLFTYSTSLTRDIFFSTNYPNTKRQLFQNVIVEKKEFFCFLNVFPTITCINIHGVFMACLCLSLGRQTYTCIFILDQFFFFFPLKKNECMTLVIH